MAPRGYYIGKLVTGDYEVGRDPSAFHKQRGFPYSQLVSPIRRQFVENMWNITSMKAGDVHRIGRKGIMLYMRPLNKVEREKFYGHEDKTKI